MHSQCGATPTFTAMGEVVAGCACRSALLAQRKTAGAAGAELRLTPGNRARHFQPALRPTAPLLVVGTESGRSASNAPGMTPGAAAAALLNLPESDKAADTAT